MHEFSWPACNSSSVLVHVCCSLAAKHICCRVCAEMKKYIRFENVVTYMPGRFSGKNLHIVPGCSYSSKRFLGWILWRVFWDITLWPSYNLLVHFSLTENFVFILHVVLQVFPTGSSVPSSDLCHWNWYSSNLILFLFFLGLHCNHCLASRTQGSIEEAVPAVTTENLTRKGLGSGQILLVIPRNKPATSRGTQVLMPTWLSERIARAFWPCKDFAKA